MSRLQKLREDRSKAIADAQAIVALAEKEDRQLTEEEAGKVDALTAQAEKAGPEIDRLSKVGALAESNAKPSDRKSPIESGKPIEELGGEKKPRIDVRQPKSRYFKEQELAYESGQFLRATLWGDKRAQLWCQDHGLGEYLAMSTDVDAKGGHLVPPGFSNMVIDLREQYGVFRQNCRVHPMARDTENIPRRASGLTIYAVGENSEITASDKGWNNVSLTARKWAGLAKYSRELSDSAIISIADDLANELAYAFALKEDQTGFLGDGTSTYHGIVGLKNKLAAGSIYDTITGNTAFSTLDLVDFTNALAKLPAYALPRTKWYISQAGFQASMVALMSSAGGVTMDSLSGQPRPMFLGFPVVISQVLPTTTAAQTSTIFGYVGDLAAAATLGDREGIAIASSAERYFEYDQLAIRGTSRYDIVVHEIGDASTAGPVVALKMASS